MLKTNRLWKDPEHHAQRCANMKAVRAVKWSDLTVRTAHIEASRATKLANSDKTSAQVKEYYATATPEKLAAHAKAISDTQSANAEKIGETSEEVWARPGMKEFISGRISVGQSAAWAEPRGEQRRENASISATKQFADPMKAERHRQACIKRDAKNGGGLKARYADPIQRAAIVAKRNATAAANRATKKAEKDAKAPSRS